jgi:hypothetical protein
MPSTPTGHQGEQVQNSPPHNSPTHDTTWRTQAGAFAVWLAAAFAIGWAIAFPHTAFAFMGITRMPDRMQTPATVAVCASYLLATMVGGLLLSILAKWALRRARCTSLAIALTYALLSAFLALYAMSHASWIAGFTQWFIQGRYVDPCGPCLGCIFSVLAGGLVWFFVILTSATHDPIGRSFLLLFLSAAIYYLAIVSWATARTVRANRVSARTTASSTDSTS